jgi:hypothetical protein
MKTYVQHNGGPVISFWNTRDGIQQFARFIRATKARGKYYFTQKMGSCVVQMTGAKNE